METIIIDKIKTFEDACNYLGYDDPLVYQFNYMMRTDTYWEYHILAYVQLCIITKALNENKPFDNWESRFPFHVGLVRTLDYNESNTETYSYKTEIKALPVLNRHIPCKSLLFNTLLTAQYAAEQFKDIYEEFLLGYSGSKH
jgi:hypothetical protein